jgi:hypothetical protein
MYTISLSDIAKFDLADAPCFVDFWNQFYEEGAPTVLGTQERIDYFAELNLGSNLTEENVRRLLRWKDPHQLTHRILSGPNEGRDNPRVVKVLADLTAINRFRNGQSTEEEMRRKAEQIFQSGIVFRAFLLHIARPHEHPIGDENVFRAYSLHTGQQLEDTWDTYAGYSDYFRRIARAMGVAQRADNIRELKRIDNALLTFGQFLRTYHTRGSDAAKRSTATQREKARALKARAKALGIYDDVDEEAEQVAQENFEKWQEEQRNRASDPTKQC